MERIYEENANRRLGGGLKDRPRCERCGRPVKISSDLYMDEEVLCTTCAIECKSTEIDDYESA